MPVHNFLRMKFFLLCLLALSSFIFYPLSSAFAQTQRPMLKLVFPFHAGLQNSSICPIPQRTLQGCCPSENRVYDFSARKACCFQPNELMTYGQEQTCCTPWKTGQTRWGQTSSSPCGGYCPPTSQHVSAGGYSSCCTDCALVDGVRAFETATSVCGTCCSRIPESCGNAGVRVCSSGTGSAYCSKIPGACNDHDDWLIGSYGEGGYTCCNKCTGTRFGETNSSCGTCCMPPDLVLSYSGVTSCCSSIALAGQNRWGRTESAVCGGYCDLATSSVYSYSGYTSCCKTCSEVLAFQSGPGNVCGTCCSAVPNNCGTAGTKVCESATGSAYCSPTPEKCTPTTDWGIGTSGEGGYSCCASCNGLRSGQTASSCGSCQSIVTTRLAISAAGTHNLNNLAGPIKFIVIGGGGGAGGGSGKYGSTMAFGGDQTTVTLSGSTYTAGGGGAGYPPIHVNDNHLQCGGAGGGGGRNGKGVDVFSTGAGRLNGGAGGGIGGGAGGFGISASRIKPNPPAQDGVIECPELLPYAGSMGRGGCFDCRTNYGDFTSAGKAGIEGALAEGARNGGSGGGGGVTCFTSNVQASTQITVSPGVGGAGGAGTWPGGSGVCGGVVIEYQKYE